MWWFILILLIGIVVSVLVSLFMNSSSTQIHEDIIRKQQDIRNRDGLINSYKGKRL